MKKIAYVRVSTPDQCLDRQIMGLQPFCDEVHVETLSAKNLKRPVYERVIRELGPGDMLVVWDLDRAFRSVVDALTEAEKLRARGVHFRIANLSVDTSTPAGMFVYTLMSALAEFERQTLAQRTKEGMAAARRRGKRIGRPRVLSDRQLRDARQRLEREGSTTASVAREMGIGPWTLGRSLRRDQTAIRTPAPACAGDPTTTP